MTRRWIGIAIILTATAVAQRLVADPGARDRANVPVAIPSTAAPHSGTLPAASHVAGEPNAAPPSDRLLPRSIAVEPPPEREQLPLGTPPPDDDPNTAASAADNDYGDGWALQTAMALGVVIGLIYVVRMVLRRANGMTAGSGSAAAVVEVLARAPVGPRAHVLLLRINERIIVAGQTQAGLNTLATFDDPDEVAGVLATVEAARPTSISSGFNKLLSQFDRGFHGPDARAEGGDDAEHTVDRARNDVSSLLNRIRTLGSGREDGDDRS